MPAELLYQACDMSGSQQSASRGVQIDLVDQDVFLYDQQDASSVDTTGRVGTGQSVVQGQCCYIILICNAI